MTQFTISLFNQQRNWDEMLVDEGKFAPNRIATVAFYFNHLLLHSARRSAQ